MTETHVYLILTDARHDETIEELLEEAHDVRPGVWVVESEAHQSRVYHDVKHHLPKNAPLFVARLDHQPKFKSVQAGLLNWVRERYDGMTA